MLLRPKEVKNLKEQQLNQLDEVTYTQLTAIVFGGFVKICVVWHYHDEL